MSIGYFIYKNFSNILVLQVKKKNIAGKNL